MRTRQLSICEFQREQLYVPTFIDFIKAFVVTANTLGIETSFYRNKIPKQDSPLLIFGLHRLSQSHIFNTILALKNAILVNFEPLTHIRNPAYLEALKVMPVIDYSDNNVSLLRACGNQRTMRFKFGFTDLFGFSASRKRAEWMLFYGVLGDRRKEIIDRLTSNGIPIRAISGTWGFERDYEIVTARAVLNINKASDSPLEIFRLWHSLCLKTPVLTEIGVDNALKNEWEHYVHFLPTLSSERHGISDQSTIDSLSRIFRDSESQQKKVGHFEQNTSFAEGITSVVKWLCEL